MDNFKTSQTEWSLTEGKNSPGAPAVQYGSEGSAPAAVTQPIKGEVFKIDASSTSQQRETGHDTPESQ